MYLNRFRRTWKSRELSDAFPKGKAGGDDFVECVSTHSTVHSTADGEDKSISEYVDELIKKSTEDAFAEHKRVQKSFKENLQTTFVAICALLAFVLAIASRESSSFATLKKSMVMERIFLPVEEIGLFKIVLCEHQNWQSTYETLDAFSYKQNHSNVFIHNKNDYVIYESIPLLNRSKDGKCAVLELEHLQIHDDAMWMLSQACSTIAIYLGSCSLIYLLASTFFGTLEIHKLALAFLLTFVFTNMTFFIFDSKCCQQHHCTMSVGSVFALSSSLLWIVAGILTVALKKTDEEVVHKKYKNCKKYLNVEDSIVSNSDL